MSGAESCIVIRGFYHVGVLMFTFAKAVKRPGNLDIGLNVCNMKIKPTCQAFPKVSNNALSKVIDYIHC